MSQKVQIQRWFRSTQFEQQLLELNNWKDKLVVTLVLAMWFGLIAGFVESIYMLIDKYARHKIVNLGQHFAWTIPLTLVTLFLVAGCLLFALSMVLPRWVGVRWIIFTFIILALLSLYTISPKIHILAILALGAGISFQLSAILAKRQASFYNFVKRTLPWMVLGWLAVAIFMLGFSL
jgi:hypothetical protein